MLLPRRVRGQLTGDRLGMTSLKISSVSWEPTRPTHDQLRIVELIPEAHTLSVDLLSPSCNRHLASLGVVETDQQRACCREWNGLGSKWGVNLNGCERPRGSLVYLWRQKPNYRSSVAWTWGGENISSERTDHALKIVCP